MIWFVGIMGVIVVALLLAFLGLGDFSELDRAKPRGFDES